MTTLSAAPVAVNPTAESIAIALGGSRAGGQWIACCPAHEDSHPSLSIMDGGFGPVFHCFAGCSGPAIRDALRSIGLFPLFRPGMEPEPVNKRVAIVPRDDSEALRTARAIEIYGQAFPCLDTTPAERYLEMRGIWEPARRTRMRFTRIQHPQTREKNVACLVVPRHDARDGRLGGIQRIYLYDDGTPYREAGAEAKLSLGTIAHGWAMLHKPAAELVIAEGVESALAASILYSRPAWARCSGFPAELPLPAMVRNVLIAADHDQSGVTTRPKVTSQERAKRLAWRIMQSGRKCEVIVPDRPGSDPNDVLLERADF